MKYLDKKFSSPGNSKTYVDNWDAVFGEKPAVCPACAIDPDPRGWSACADCRAIRARTP